MFVHSVYFWLKPDLSDADREAFGGGLASLKSIESVRAIYIGAPVASERAVVDSSFTMALTVVFDDQAGHVLYQDHPAHTAFAERFGGMWDRLIVYDAAG